MTGGGAALPALDVNFSRRAATAYMPTARYWLGRAAGALEAVEDQVEPELVLTLARSGALDTDLLSQQPFYGTNFTRPLLFIEDGAYFVNKATALGLTGAQWGVMNEPGSYPGQPWLWLYTLWYQVPGWTNSANIDLIAIYMTGLATILLLLVPFIPGLRDIPPPHPPPPPHLAPPRHPHA